MPPSEQPEARTSRLVLRPLRLEDAPDVHMMRSLPEVMVYTPTGPATDIAQTEDWIRGCLARPDCYNFVVELLPTEPEQELARRRVVGTLGGARGREVGYLLHPDVWGKGIATEAMKAFMPLFWKHYEGVYDYATAEIDPDHFASRKVLLKCGFTLWERREKDFQSPTLGLRDTEVYRAPRPGTSLR